MIAARPYVNNYLQIPKTLKLITSKCKAVGIFEGANANPFMIRKDTSGELDTINCGLQIVYEIKELNDFVRRTGWRKTNNSNGRLECNREEPEKANLGSDGWIM